MLLHLSSWSLYLILTWTPLATADPVCYYPNGYSESSPEYQPCQFSNGDISMCCATNRTNPFGGDHSNGLTADRCLENGLCLSNFRDEDGQFRTEYWRDQCTSPDWAGTGCLDVCTNGTSQEGGSSGRTVLMTPCDGTARSKYWCCGDNNNACCGTPAAVTIPAQFARESATPSPSPSNNATTPSSTPSSTPSANNESSSLSAGAKAGVGVGVGVGSIAIIGCLVFYFLRRRRRRSSTRTMAAPAELGTGPVAGQREVQELDQSRVYEKPAGAEDSRSELPG